MTLTFPAILSAVVSFITSWGLKIIAAVVVFLVGIKLISMATKWLHNSPKLSKMDNSLRSFLVGFSKIALYAVLRWNGMRMVPLCAAPVQNAVRS